MVLSLHGLEGNAGIVETTTETSKLILNAITKNTYLTNTELAANNSHRNSRTSATAGAVYLPQASTEGGAAGYNRGRAPRHRSMGCSAPHTPTKKETFFNVSFFVGVL